MNIEEELFGIKKRTQAINSKRKGNVNELNLTKVLQEWTGHEFARVPRSGGLRWKNRMDICGDVINVDPDFEFPFSVETKHVKSLGLSMLHPQVLRSNSVVFKYFNQCQADAKATGKIPFLILRHNDMKKNTYYIFLNLNQLTWTNLSVYVKNIMNSISWENEHALFGYNSEDFFKAIDYETFKEIM